MKRTRRLLFAWPASGPALLAILLAARTVAADGLELPIGLSIAAVLAGVAVVAGMRLRWSPAALLVGPIAFVASPARTELSFNLARPDETGWYVFTLATAVGIGLSLAAAITLAVTRIPARWAVVPMTVLGALGFTGLITAIDPQPDLGRELTDAEVADLPAIALLNFAYGVPPQLGVVDGHLRARLDNDSDLPHTFSVDALDVDIYVPAGRRAVLDVAVPAGVDSLDVYCGIDEHAELGMVVQIHATPG